jgi:hypothetical protein
LVQSTNIKQQPIDEERQRTARYQERQIKISAALNIIMVGAAIVTLISLWIFYETLNASRQQADTAQRQLELSERPWMEVKDPPRLVGPLRFDEKGAHASFQFSFCNVGQSVAEDVDFYPVWLAAPGHNPLAEQNEACDAAREGHPAHPNLASHWTIFPTNCAPSMWQMNILKTDIDAAVNGWAPGSGNSFLELFLVGCVDYRFTFEKKRHQTKFAYELFRRDEPVFFYPSAGSISADNIGFYWTPRASHDAD